MVYISADGSISNDAPRSRCLSYASSTPRTFITIVGIIIAIFWKMGDFSPLSNGKVPAAKKSPTEHWNFMRDNMAFVREMTEPLHAKTKATAKEVKKVIKQYEIQRSISHIDFGGVDGHVAESGDLRDLETIRVTRCSTTRSAITAYMVSERLQTR
jgi:hypothetical protein